MCLSTFDKVHGKFVFFVVSPVPAKRERHWRLMLDEEAFRALSRGLLRNRNSE